LSEKRGRVKRERKRGKQGSRKASLSNGREGLARHPGVRRAM